jgi:hypothetical protein
MAARKPKAVDLTGIRQPRTRFQLRVFGGIGPATGYQLIVRRACTWPHRAPSGESTAS